MQDHLIGDPVQSHQEAHEIFKTTQADLCRLQQDWEEAQGRFERAALSQGLDGDLTLRARRSLLHAYERYAVARAHLEVSRRTLWELAKVAQLERELSQA